MTLKSLTNKTKDECRYKRNLRLVKTNEVENPL